MKLIVSILTFFLVANLVGIGDDKSDVKQVVAEIDQNTKWVPEVLVDPKTKVVFYLESDRRHVSAISPEGKICGVLKSFRLAKRCCRMVLGRLESVCSGLLLQTSMWILKTKAMSA